MATKSYELESNSSGCLEAVLGSIRGVEDISDGIYSQCLLR